MQNKITIISVIIIILSLGIISAIIYKQRAVVIDSGLKAGQAIIEFFPIGDSKKPTWTSTPTSSGTSTNNSVINSSQNNNISNQPAWEKITNTPVVGADVLNLSKASNTLVYLEKETGNIYMLKGGVGEPNRISNVTILEVFDVYFGLDKNKNIGAIVRFPKDDHLESILLNINLKNQTGTTSDSLPVITKQALKTSIIAYAVSPKKDRVLYLEDLGNRAAVYVTDFNFKNPQLLRVLSFKDWLISWPEENIVVFQTKINNQTTGSLYYLNIKSKSFNRVGNGILGLTMAASRDTKKIIYSVSNSDSFNFVYRELSSGKSNTLTPKTLPEKCLWLDNNIAFICAVSESLPKAIYPDDWYKGKISFRDNLWIYYSNTGKSSRLYDLNRENSNLDLLPQAKDDSNNLYFTDKITGILYRLNANQVFEP